jgi:predicted phosphodiesterase
MANQHTGESLVAQTARQYRIKYGSKTPTRQLARILYKENNLLFKDIEHARYTLRRIEGKSGSKIKNEMRDKSLVMSEPRPLNPYSLPESDEESFEPFYIKGHKRVLLISDIHLPYHNIESITACFDFAKKEKPDAVLINGDILDFHSISYFEKDPTKKRFSEELDMFKEFFNTLKRIFKCKIYLKCGNHEERYEKFLVQKAPELMGVKEFKLDEILKARAEGIDIIKDKRIITLNELPVIHGHEFGRGVFSPVNSARGLFLQAKHSCIKGDSHVTSEHTEPNIMGKIMTTWSVGCLCGLSPRWLPLNKWNAGFAIVDLDSNGVDFEVRNKRIFKGKVL